MSTHGRTGIHKALLGSTAEKVFRHANCPVLIVGPAVTIKPRANGKLSRILYATDFRMESLAAAPFAISLAREQQARLILLYCAQQRDEDAAIMRHNLSDLVPFGVELTKEPDCIVERGSPAEKILEVAEGHGADLIVLGVHSARDGKIEAEHFFHPGVLKIVTEAKCPVLTVCS